MKHINLILTSLCLLIFNVVLLLYQDHKQNKKPDFSQQETSGSIVLQSGEMLIIGLEPKIMHLGYVTDDYRQVIVQEAYDLGGIEFLSLIECENGLRNPARVGDAGKSHGLCQLNTRWHPEPLSPEWNDRRFQLSICYYKRKGGTKFYGPQRLIGGKRCGEVVKKRFYFL